MTASLSVILLLLHLLTTVLGASGCPTICACKWRGGKQTVECIDKSLLIIPEGLDDATQVLDVSGNNFRSLQREKFLQMSLINLQKIFLSRCGLKSVQDGAFKGLTNLIELDCSGNLLETVPTEALLDCPSLMKLSLSRNPISALDRLSFNHLSFLNTLNLKNCRISNVNEEAFVGLYSLEWLDLSQNDIKVLSNMRLFPNTLKGIRLEENPWKCDCKIASLNAWLDREIVSTLIAPTCLEPPRFRDVPIRMLDPDELACSPEVLPASLYFELEEGKNISLICKVKSVPSAKILWLFKDQILQNNTDLVPGLRLVYFTEETERQQQSNLYIYNSNAEQNGTFYCRAENVAGTSYANYTVMIFLKETPIRLEENQNFPIEIVAVMSAVALIFLSLCFVALIMSFIRCRAESKGTRNAKDNFLQETETTNAQKKSNLKAAEEIEDELATNRTSGAPSLFPSLQRNPDIINGIRNKDVKYSGPFSLYQENPLPIISNCTSNSANFLRDSTQPYLKPTLTSNLRPVSAPSFERYIESRDVRYTVDGYHQKHEGVIKLHKSVTTTPSHLLYKRTSKIGADDEREGKLRRFMEHMDLSHNNASVFGKGIHNVKNT